MHTGNAGKAVWAGRTTVFWAGIVLVAALIVLGLLAPPARASSTFTVNRTGDQSDPLPGDATCDVDPSIIGAQCTLRAAIQEANNNANPAEVDKIDFDISEAVDPGVKTITPNSSLPSILEPVAIDGYSQPGSSANTLARETDAKPLVQLNGAKAAGNGLTIWASNSSVQGLVINRFSGFAVEVEPNANAGTAEGVSNVTIAGNFVGTDPTGTLDKGNGGGVHLFATSGSTIGGGSRESRNLISGNGADGVFVEGIGGLAGSSNHNSVGATS